LKGWKEIGLRLEGKRRGRRKQPEKISYFNFGETGISINFVVPKEIKTDLRQQIQEVL